MSVAGSAQMAEIRFGAQAGWGGRMGGFGVSVVVVNEEAGGVGAGRDLIPR